MPIKTVSSLSHRIAEGGCWCDGENLVNEAVERCLNQLAGAFLSVDFAIEAMTTTPIVMGDCIHVLVTMVGRTSDPKRSKP